MSNHLAKKYTPREILAYIVENNLEADFLTKMSLHVGNFSIAEIADGVVTAADGVFTYSSDAYRIKIPITDEKVIEALKTGIYFSTFVSGNGESRQLHFFVHNIPIREKQEREEEIAAAVVQYMIYRTIIALRLDTPKKIDEYLV